MSPNFAGIDLGGTSMKAAIANAAGEILIQESIPTESHAGSATVLDRIVALISHLRQRIDDREPLAGLGMGVPGLVDVASGTTKFLPNLPTQWRDVPVGEILASRLDCSVRLLNDVRAATLGELRFGHGRDRPNVTLAFFAIGTGIGGGVAIDGQLRLGPLGAAGELGHQTIVPDGPRCGCGNLGCLEAFASGPAIAAEGVRLMRSGLAPALHAVVEGHSDRVTPREMLEAALSGDQHVREALVRAATWIGIAAANVVTILHPDLIVLGGGVAELGDILIDTIQKTIGERVGMFPSDNVQVVRSRLGDQAGLLGAIAVASHSSQK